MAQMQSIRDIGERILRRQTLRLVKLHSPVRRFGDATAALAANRARGECVRCGGVGMIVAYFDADDNRLAVANDTMPDYHHTAAVECACKRRLRLRAFRASIPPEFRRANLARLRPRLDCHEMQAGAIEFVKADPLASYAFCGRNRAGKSYMAWCLARNAYLNGRRVAACNLSQLLDEYRATERVPRDGDETPVARPSILSGDLTIRGVQYCLLLQEFDKPRSTPYAVERLFDLIDTAFNYQHQLLITSNLSLTDLARHWSEQGARYGNGIISRILERCNSVSLF